MRALVDAAPGAPGAPGALGLDSDAAGGPGSFGLASAAAFAAFAALVAFSMTLASGPTPRRRRAPVAGAARDAPGDPSPSEAASARPRPPPKRGSVFGVVRVATPRGSVALALASLVILALAAMRARRHRSSAGHGGGASSLTLKTPPETIAEAVAIVRALAPPPDRACVREDDRAGEAGDDVNDDANDVNDARLFDGVAAPPRLDDAYGPYPRRPLSSQTTDAENEASDAPHFDLLASLGVGVRDHFGADAPVVARRRFARGVLLRFGYNAAESRRNFLGALDALEEFEASQEQDASSRGDPPSSSSFTSSSAGVMALWGVAYSLMPDANNWRTTRRQRAAGRAASHVAATLAATNEGTLRDDLKARALIDAVAAFFGTNVFDHAAGSTDEDPEEDLDGEAAQLEAHARYLRVLAEGARKAATSAAAAEGASAAEAGGGGGGGRAAEDDHPGKEEGASRRYSRGPSPFGPGEEAPFAASLPPLDVFSFPPLDERFGEYASAKNATDPTDDRSVADADLLAFLAEARVNLPPGRYWTVGGARTDPANEPANNSSTRRSSSSAWTAAPHPGSHAVRAYDTARRALALAPTHPLAAHAMVHLTESLPVANLASGPRRFDSLAAMESALSPPARGASLSPRLGADAAEALRSTFGRSTRSALVSPHLAHMAAHHLVRVGDWKGAVEVSERAVAADRFYLREGCVAPYGDAHDAAMLAFAAHVGDAGAEGERVAIKNAVTRGPGFGGGERGDVAGGFATAFYRLPTLFAFARFGRWSRILEEARDAERRRARALGGERDEFEAIFLSRREKKKGAKMKMRAAEWTAAVASDPWHRAEWAYALGLASAAGFRDAPRTSDGETRETSDGISDSDGSSDGSAGSAIAARSVSPADWLLHLRELAERHVPDHDAAGAVAAPGLSSRLSDAPFGERSVFKPHKRRLAAIMAHVLAARIITTASPSAADAARESLGDGWVRAAGYLESAVAAQDALPFMEPEHFYLPTRLCLGEALLRAGARGRARAVFEEDLGAWHPGNPWATGGVRRAREGAVDDVETACFEVFP